VNTYERDNKGGAFEAGMQSLLEEPLRKILEAIEKHIGKRREQMKEQKEITLDDLLAAGLLRRNETLDPWGNPLKLVGAKGQVWEIYQNMELQSAGIDGAWGTADDVKLKGAEVVSQRLERRRFGAGLRGKARGGPEEMVAFDMAVPMAAAAPVMEKTVGDAAAESGAAAAEPPRIRQYFPETLYFNPALITDGGGRATLTLPLADSITTWRLTCMASSAKGELGSTTSGIRVFQDFFVDVDFPVALTQNDQISVPVAVYNYLKTDQQVRLEAQPGDWFEFRGEKEQTVTLKPSEVKAVYFPITVKGLGVQKFTVMGFGEKKSDAVSRSVEVVPDGREELVTFSGRLEGKVAHTVTVPEAAIPGASKVFVKVYPGVLSQVVEGLDNMLRMPCGCFEQTSSATYPNILILDYMKTTKKITPELQMKAEGFINNGYQRLLSYEVPGGGFEWFGNAPAHRILTAFGLMEFHDMS
jgi:hypothetical protein